MLCEPPTNAMNILYRQFAFEKMEGEVEKQKRHFVISSLRHYDVCQLDSTMGQVDSCYV